ncbi:right-handed parallel beta-helix repeat-containing protein [Bremerella sp.]|uniref:right-handed parallel beta-helix repeat-containing protein n=1 Tax=Bremerella sp. TaxID=2795602 RepID=UPI00391D3C54
MQKTFFTIFLSLTCLSLTHAAEIYVTPQGAGEKDGTSWESAHDASSLEEIVNKLNPGDTLLLGSGNYAGITLKINCWGTAEDPITIQGVDRGEGLPTFTHTWKIEDPSKGATAIRLGDSASHLNFHGLRFEGYRTGVQADKTSNGKGRTHLSFDNVDVNHCRYGFYLSDCDDLEILNCDLVRYSKHAFRLEQGCDRVRFTDCLADCSEADPEWEKQTELLPFGFNVNSGGSPNTHIAFLRCTAKNNMMPFQKNRYKNGDGFVVEGGATDVSFVDCRGIRNQDAGYDLKVEDVTLRGCIAIGNGRQVRIWTTATLDNCYFGYGGTGVWCNGGPITVDRCTFYDLSVAAMTDDRAKHKIMLTDCVIANCQTTKRQTASGGGVLLDETEVIGPQEKAKSTEKPASRPVPPWDGFGDPPALSEVPGKGYQAPAVAATP